MPERDDDTSTNDARPREQARRAKTILDGMEKIAEGERKDVDDLPTDAQEKHIVRLVKIIDDIRDLKIEFENDSLEDPSYTCCLEQNVVSLFNRLDGIRRDIGQALLAQGLDEDDSHSLAPS